MLFLIVTVGHLWTFNVINTQKKCQFCLYFLFLNHSAIVQYVGLESRIHRQKKFEHSVLNISQHALICKRVQYFISYDNVFLWCGGGGAVITQPTGVVIYRPSCAGYQWNEMGLLWWRFDEWTCKQMKLHPLWFHPISESSKLVFLSLIVVISHYWNLSDSIDYFSMIT